MRACLVVALASAALAALVGVTAPRVALACGGTFCDRPTSPTAPPAMPVDQTGENILFVMDGKSVEAHVNIQYTGDPERFAWIVPVPTIPTSIEPGSQPLFSNMLAATVPTLSVASVRGDSCSTFGAGTGFGCSTSESADSAAFGPGEEDSARGEGEGGSSGGGLQVVEKKQVGAYEVTVLDGGTAEELLTWLDENDYLVPENTGSLLPAYLEKGYAFLAVKLVAGAGLDEIHPIVFTYPGNQPCVPLRLTAVAAKEDMEIRAFFLATGRYVPKNYKLVLLNDVRLDWIAPFASGGG
jgi:hypothetical protein